MRVDPFYVVNLSGALDQTQATQEQLSQELSSGLRVTSIGTDPVASAQNVQLLNSIQPGMYGVALTELVCLEVYYRQRAGESPTADEYRDRFPNLEPTRLAEALEDKQKTGVVPDMGPRSTNVVSVRKAPVRKARRR